MKKPIGQTPSIALTNPKFPHNVGMAIRAASCFGLKQVWMTGKRIQDEIDALTRIPREERLKGYKDVDLIHDDRFFDRYQGKVTPVAIELIPGSQILTDFEHPENALYVFGPEDGSIDASVRRHCHHFVAVPTAHCMNLSATIYVVLYDRMLKRHKSGVQPVNFSGFLKEERGFAQVLMGE
jgi:tRNA(Leu) C34 or U34 (ribose-2'-O)-methylase TrmL